MPVRTLGPMEWIWQGSHINWKKDKVPARTLDPRGWIVMSHVSWGGEQSLEGKFKKDNMY